MARSGIRRCPLYGRFGGDVGISIRAGGAHRHTFMARGRFYSGEVQKDLGELRAEHEVQLRLLRNEVALLRQIVHGEVRALPRSGDAA